MSGIFIDFLKNPSTWLSIVSIAIAIFAVFQTGKQIKLSNKQHLFDRRLRNYLLLKELFESCRSQQIILKNTQNPNSLTPKKVRFDFIALTGNELLSPISLTIANILAADEQSKFINKLDEMKRLATESRLVFPKAFSEQLYAFVMAYVDVLINLFRDIYLTTPKPVGTIPALSIMLAPRDKTMQEIIAEQYLKLLTSYEVIESKKVVEELEKCIML